MKRYRRITSALIASFSFLFALSPNNSQAQSFNDYSYVVAGLSHIAINSKAPEIDGRDSSGGLLLIYGRSFNETWFFEGGVSGGHDFRAGPTQEIYYPADRVEYASIFVGARKSLWPLSSHRWSPWLTFGVGITSINWDTYWYDLSGFSYYYGIGTDISISERFLFRLQLDNTHYSAEDGYDHPSYSTDVRQTAGALVFKW